MQRVVVRLTMVAVCVALILLISSWSLASTRFVYAGNGQEHITYLPVVSQNQPASLLYVRVDRAFVELPQFFRVGLTGQPVTRMSTGLSLGSLVGPAWSPTGSSIAFASDHEGNPEIYVLNVADGNLTRLTNRDGIDTDPAWSPDGSMIAFSGSGDLDFEGAEIFTMRADGSGVQRLTQQESLAVMPSWSHDGEKIAYVTVPDEGAASLHVIDADGDNDSEVSTITFDFGPMRNRRPAWSPVSHEIAFRSDKSGNEEIYVVDLDTTVETNVTSNAAANSRRPAWSPDGTRLAFASDLTGDPEIYVIDKDGAGRKQLTNSPGIDSYPTWSDDGEYIAFDSERDGNREIYVMHADGSNPINLTQDGAADDLYAVWAPR